MVVTMAAVCTKCAQGPETYPLLTTVSTQYNGTLVCELSSSARFWGRWLTFLFVQGS